MNFDDSEYFKQMREAARDDSTKVIEYLEEQRINQEAANKKNYRMMVLTFIAAFLTLIATVYFGLK